MTEALLGPLGLDRPADVLYREVLRSAGETPQTLGQLVGWPLRAVQEQLDRLVGLHLVRVVGGVVVAEPPDGALGDLLQQENRRLAAAEARLTAARMTILDLLAEHHARQLVRPEGGGSDGVELIRASDTVEVYSKLLVQTTGDVWNLRRDQWSVPGTEGADAVLISELATGRTSRAIYPVAALQPVSEGIRARIDAGELVRVLPQVPSRLIVFGAEAALTTERWGSPGGRRVLVRQSALVHALRDLAHGLWERAVTPPEVVAGNEDPVRLDPDGDEQRGGRRALLALMARGAVDDQIARTLGVSLRTVRRHIAALLAELGADSRFQAGAEAVRRGWV